MERCSSPRDIGRALQTRARRSRECPVARQCSRTETKACGSTWWTAIAGDIAVAPHVTCTSQARGERSPSRLPGATVAHFVIRRESHPTPRVGSVRTANDRRWGRRTLGSVTDSRGQPGRRLTMLVGAPRRIVPRSRCRSTPQPMGCGHEGARRLRVHVRQYGARCASDRGRPGCGLRGQGRMRASVRAR